MCFRGAVAAHLTGMHSAIKMLNSRIRVLFHHLVAIQKGQWCKYLFVKFCGCQPTLEEHTCASCNWLRNTEPTAKALRKAVGYRY